MNSEKGEIATTFTIVALIIISLGVIIGSQILSNPTLQSLFSRAQSQIVVINNAHESTLTLNFGALAEHNSNQMRIPGTLCFSEAAGVPSTGSYKLEAVVHNGQNTTIIGQTRQERILSNPNQHECPNQINFILFLARQYPTEAGDPSPSSLIEINLVQTGNWDTFVTTPVATIGRSFFSSIFDEVPGEGNRGGGNEGNGSGPTLAPTTSLGKSTVTAIAQFESNLPAAYKEFRYSISMCGLESGSGSCSPSGSANSGNQTYVNNADLSKTFTFDNTDPGRKLVRINYDLVKQDGTLESGSDPIIINNGVVQSGCTKDPYTFSCNLSVDPSNSEIIVFNVTFQGATPTVTLDLKVMGAVPSDYDRLEYNAQICDVNQADNQPTNCIQKTQKFIRTATSGKDTERVLFKDLAKGKKIVMVQYGLYKNAQDTTPTNTGLQLLFDQPQGAHGCTQERDNQCHFDLEFNKHSLVAYFWMPGSSPYISPTPTQIPNNPTVTPEERRRITRLIGSFYNSSSRTLTKLTVRACANGSECLDDDFETSIPSQDYGTVIFDYPFETENITYLTITRITVEPNNGNSGFTTDYKIDSNRGGLLRGSITNSGIEAEALSQLQAADLDKNSCINSADANTVYQELYESSEETGKCELVGDIDCNGIVNTFDMAYITENFNTGPGCQSGLAQ